MTPNENRPKKPQLEDILDLKRLDQEFTERLQDITDEFKNGFNFIKKNSRSVTFFGSARTLPNESDYQKTQELAKRIVHELGYSIVTGGGPGIMEAANRGSFENGGKSLGLTIKLPKEQITNGFLTDHVDFKYFFSRKVCMSFAAEAYVFLPGGFGTFDELFEILTLVQTKKIVKVPVILFGSEFWNNFDKFIRENLLVAEKIDTEDLELYKISDDIEEIIQIIKNSPIRISA